MGCCAVDTLQGYTSINHANLSFSEVGDDRTQWQFHIIVGDQNLSFVHNYFYYHGKGLSPRNLPTVYCIYIT